MPNRLPDSSGTPLRHGAWRFGRGGQTGLHLGNGPDPQAVERVRRKIHSSLHRTKRHGVGSCSSPSGHPKRTVYCSLNGYIIMKAAVQAEETGGTNRGYGRPENGQAVGRTSRPDERIVVSQVI